MDDSYPDSNLNIRIRLALTSDLTCYHPFTELQIVAQWSPLSDLFTAKTTVPQKTNDSLVPTNLNES